MPYPCRERDDASPLMKPATAKQGETKKTLAATSSTQSKEECRKRLQVLLRAKKEERNIAKCTDEENKQWKRLSAAVDSGACDNVAAPTELPAYEDYIVETEASINNEGFVSARQLWRSHGTNRNEGKHDTRQQLQGCRKHYCQ